MSLAKARAAAANQQRFLAAILHAGIANPFPGKSKPVSKRTARLWRGATITFK